MFKVVCEEGNEKKTFVPKAKVLLFAAVDDKRGVVSGIVGEASPHEVAVLLKSVSNTMEKILEENPEAKENLKLIYGLEKASGKKLIDTREIMRSEEGEDDNA